ncbi:hypothetical protein BJX61DRAFT_357184 [Aspergillus egyptiacus]|nr:hypothetical protein BJX61DRAFT_357184 [Aspergillus egyptiacus]
MCPDINSLPPSRSASVSPRQRRTLSSLLDTLAPTQPISTNASPDSPSTNMNNNNHTSNNGTTPATAEPQRRHHHPMGSERRRSGNLNLNLNSNSYADPSIGDVVGYGLRTSSPSNLGGSPVIGTGDPHHHRTPSLGELHQELEQEQEAHVNRLLQTIRSQQARLQLLEQQHPQSALDDTTPASERSTPFPPIAPVSNAGSRTSTTQLSSSLSSRRPSQAHSPNLRPLNSNTLEWVPGPGDGAARRGSRDESSFYQAEATALARENQVLRQRIRELVSELTTNNSSARGERATSTDPSRTTETVTVAQTASSAGSEGESSDKT